MKRLNPKTGLIFKMGDKREDGRVFYSYRSTVNQNGYNREDWVSEASFKKLKENIKTTQAQQQEFAELKEQAGAGFRINPITKRIFREGDIRDDGYYREDWAHPDVYTRKKQKKKNTQEKQAELAKILRDEGNLKPRINTETNAPFKRGDIENGKYFWEYRYRNIRKDGTIPEIWLTKQEFESQSIKLSENVERISRQGLNAAAEGVLVKRLNPKTGKPFVSVSFPPKFVALI